MNKHISLLVLMMIFVPVSVVHSMEEKKGEENKKRTLSQMEEKEQKNLVIQLDKLLIKPKDPSQIDLMKQSDYPSSDEPRGGNQEPSNQSRRKVIINKKSKDSGSEKISFETDEQNHLQQHSIEDLISDLRLAKNDGEVESCLKKYAFETAFFEEKTAVFAFARGRCDEKLQRGLVDYIEKYNQEEAAFLENCREFDKLRWNSRNVTLVEKLLGALGKLFRQMVVKDEPNMAHDIMGHIELLKKNDLSRIEDLFSKKELEEIERDENFEKELCVKFETLLSQFVKCYPTQKLHEFELIVAPGCNALMLAVQIGSIEHVKEFLKSVNVNARDRYEKTALHYCNDVEIARLLVAAQIDTHAGDTFGQSALFFIRDYATTEFLVKNKHILPDQRTRSNQNILFSCQDRKLLELYIAHGADVKAEDRSGQTVFFEHGANVDIIELLHANGADVTRKNAAGQTPLFAARTKEVALRLVQYGVDVNVRDQFDRDWKAHMKHISPFSPLAEDLLSHTEEVEKEGSMLS